MRISVNKFIGNAYGRPPELANSAERAVENRDVGSAAWIEVALDEASSLDETSTLMLLVAQALMAEGKIASADNLFPLCRMDQIHASLVVLSYAKSKSRVNPWLPET